MTVLSSQLNIDGIYKNMNDALDANEDRLQRYDNVTTKPSRPTSRDSFHFQVRAFSVNNA